MGEEPDCRWRSRPDVGTLPGTIRRANSDSPTLAAIKRCCGNHVRPPSSHHWLREGRVASAIVGGVILLRGDFVGAVFQLKEAQRGELLVNGSCQLVHALIDHNLVDEVRLMVFPVVLGAGLRLFGDSPHAWPFRLLESRAVGPDGVLVVRYEPKPQNG